MVIVRPEGLYQSKIEPTTFRVVAQCLNRLRHPARKSNEWIIGTCTCWGNRNVEMKYDPSVSDLKVLSFERHRP
jgi:hypothetical protein